MEENKCKFPDIETERLILRRFEADDVHFIYNHFSNEDVCRYLLDEEPLKELEEARELVDIFLNTEGKTYNRWLIVRKTDNIPMGTCGFHNCDRRNYKAEIGYDLGKDHWGQGYGLEALEAALKNGFENMGLNRVEAFVYPENEKSLSLLRKLNFIKEGIIRDKHFFRGKFYDHWCCSLLKKDWKSGADMSSASK